MCKTEGDRLAKVLLHFGLIEDETKTLGKIVCPFHEDINPSMMYNLDEGSYYCLGCGEGGSSSIDFISRLAKENNKNVNALKVLCGILKRKEIRQLKMTKRVDRRYDYELQLVKAHNYYFGLKKNDWSKNPSQEELLIIDYMTSRGFSPPMLNRFKARYTYNDVYPIVFPIVDNGKFCGYVCRAVNNEEAEQKRKYLYNRGFRREQCLSGTYEYGSVVYIVEGHLDMLKMKSFGIKNVVAILGWKISQTQIEKLRKQNIKRIVCCLDNDKAGEKGKHELHKHFNVIDFVYGEGIKDPGQMSKREFIKQINITKNKYKKGRNY